LKDTIIRHLDEYLSPYAIVLFGSQAKGLTHKESDIDIAFLANHKFSEYEIFMIAQSLANKLKKEVDLVDLSKASTVLRAQIVGTGTVILDKDPLSRMKFFMQALKEYALLNEERRPVFERIKERGSMFHE
jgi:predicted nucleotidyltransferase